MKNSDLLLFFFVIYSWIITFMMCYMYCKLKETIDNKDDYIEKLKFQLANLHKK